MIYEDDYFNGERNEKKIYSDSDKLIFDGEFLWVKT